MREPDWEALSDLQFLLYNRVADSLNAALSSIALSDIPEAQDKPPGFWKDRASVKVANVLNLFTAWSYLARFKLGETVPDRAIRPFRVNTLLEWIGQQLQLVPPPALDNNVLLYANQECIQEALLLLYSAAFTQGTGVRLEMEPGPLGLWFRVQFARLAPLPTTLDALLRTFSAHWRAQDTVFELTTARDFIRLNGADLLLNSTEKLGEFAFFVRAAGIPREKIPPAYLGQTQPASLLTPAALAAVRAAGDITTPVVQEQPAAPVTVADEHATPVVLSDDNITTPPRLADLRPLRAYVGIPAANSETPDDDASTGAVSIDLSSHIADTVVNQGTPTVPIAVKRVDPAPSAGSATDGSIIVPVRLPSPKLPDSLHTPPAKTSNVALTRDTQTLKPVTPDTAPTEPPDTASHETGPQGADNHSREDTP